MIPRHILRVSKSDLKVTRNFIVSSRLANANSGSAVKRYAKGLLIGATAGSIIYDGYYNEFEVAGGLSRFLRSLKIAAIISLDYSWNLYGLENGTELYDQVRAFIPFPFLFRLKISNTVKKCSDFFLINFFIDFETNQHS